MSILQEIKKRRLVFDGATGTVLQSRSLIESGRPPETLCVTAPHIIEDLHLEYLKSGADIIKTCTFGANPLKLENGSSLEAVVDGAMTAAKNAVSRFGRGFIALDVGPLGKLMQPVGDLSFEDAVKAYSALISYGAKKGADLVLIETESDLYETKAAVIAAKESCSLPIFVTLTFGSDGRLLTGGDVLSAIALLEGLSVDAIGMNCGAGPEQMLPLLEQFVANSSLPVIVNPNAGLPIIRDGQTVFDLSAEDFALRTALLAKKGAHIVGGCCGTAPEYIKALRGAVDGIEYSLPVKKDKTLISSYTRAVEIGGRPILIGERINPTGKPAMKQALRERDVDYVLRLALEQSKNGADALDINAGLPDIDEKEMLPTLVSSVQGVTDLPLQIDTSDPVAMERALRIYNGKALINSVNGKKESLDTVLPLAAKYGGVVVALTLDESGIPQTAEGRLQIAERICREAERYGIEKKDIIVDPLTMAVSADPSAASITLESVRLIREKLSVNTVLGVSNVSFGLPSRETVNRGFFTLALQNGLSAAIMNPNSVAMMSAYKTFCLLMGFDPRCEEYISFASALSEESKVSVAEKKSSGGGLLGAIVSGLSAEAERLTATLLETEPSSRIIDEMIIPALDTVGRGFENKTVFLPQLLMSADAAKASFDVIKDHLSKKGEKKGGRGSVVLATVKGDIHDIGKNIVKVLLENYGFDVTDLGRDVPPQDVLSAAIEKKAGIVGLSALMTTTVPAMEETVRLIKENLPSVKTVVGGAVLTAEYAASMGADKYAADAMETVRYAEEIFG